MKEETQTKYCPHCGATMRENWQSLSPGLVTCLVKAIRAVKEKKENRFHWHHDLKLSNNESHNFQKLRFHGLIAHAEEQNKKSGYWLITSRGGQFLRGEISVPKRVKTFRNKVVGHDLEVVHISRFRNETGWFESEFNFEIHEGKVTEPGSRQLALVLH